MSQSILQAGRDAFAKVAEVLGFDKKRCIKALKFEVAVDTPAMVTVKEYMGECPHERDEIGVFMVVPSPLVLWVVGMLPITNSTTQLRNGWDLQAIVTDPVRADQLCSTEDHFMAPLQVGELTSVLTQWPGLVFPRKGEPVSYFPDALKDVHFTTFPTEEEGGEDVRA